SGASEGSPLDLVAIKVGDSIIETAFSYKNETRTPNELLQLEEWRILKELLGEFKAITTEHHIVPIVLFFPTKEHIYAEYSTTDSATSGMTIRDQQIAAKNNTESAVRALCREIGVELVSLSS